MNKMNNLKDAIEDIIKRWVRDNYGESEVENPSWNIEELANELVRNTTALHWIVEEIYAMEDVTDIAEANDIKLTPSQVRKIAKNFMDDDSTMKVDRESIEYWINRCLEEDIDTVEKQQYNRGHKL